MRPSIQDPFIYVHSNIEGTTRLLDLAREHNIANFVYASSSSVYGSSTAEVLREEDVVERPVSPYAATKKACELIAYTYHHLYGLNTTGLRFFTVYGPRGRPDMAPFKFIDRIFNGNPIQQYGDGYTSRDYTFISDIVDGVVRSIDRPLGYQVFNLGNGRPFLLKNFIALVEENVGKKAIIQVMPEQPGDVKHTCACIGKARELLGYSPQVTFEEGIAKTVQWYKLAHAAGVFDSDEDDGSSDTMNTASVSPTVESVLASAIKRGSKDRLARTVSDMELSSFVQKATEPIERRTSRFVTENKSSDFNSAYLALYAKPGTSRSPSSSGGGAAGTPSSPPVSSSVFALSGGMSRSRTTSLDQDNTCVAFGVGES